MQEADVGCYSIWQPFKLDPFKILFPLRSGLML